MQHSIHETHMVGERQAHAAGLSGKDADAAANDYATKWDSVLAPSDDPPKSPLYHAIPAAWGPAQKYREIGTYATDILTRAEQ